MKLISQLLTLVTVKTAQDIHIQFNSFFFPSPTPFILSMPSSVQFFSYYMLLNSKGRLSVKYSNLKILKTHLIQSRYHYHWDSYVRVDWHVHLKTLLAIVLRKMFPILFFYEYMFFSSVGRFICVFCFFYSSLKLIWSV